MKYVIRDYDTRKTLAAGRVATLDMMACVFEGLSLSPRLPGFMARSAWAAIVQNQREDFFYLRF